MGGARSKSVSKSVTDILNTVTTRTVLSCGAQMTQDINRPITISGSGNTIDLISLKNIGSIDLKCLQDVNVASNAAADINKQISQLSAATSSGFLSGMTSSKAASINDALTSIRNKITTENIQKCSATLTQTQSGAITINATDSDIGKIQIENVGKLVTKCIQDTLIKGELEVLDKLDLDQTTKAKTDASLFSISLGIFGIVVVLIIGFIIYKIFTAGGAEQAPVSGMEPVPGPSADLVQAPAPSTTDVLPQGMPADPPIILPPGTPPPGMGGGGRLYKSLDRFLKGFATRRS